MSKAFTRESDDDDEDLDAAPKLPQGTKNYITPGGYRRLLEEFDQLWKGERPELVKVIHWAASNGDRSENGDYIYGKKRLREIDRRIRFLSKRLEYSEVIDPAQRGDCDQVFFGATVTVSNQRGEENTYSIVGMDEVDLGRGHISWISPLAMALLKAREGDVVTLRTPGGVEELDVVEIRYQALDA
ncbi:transcription elongation factor GreB [Sulfurimicrobium lacus]|uniref:Transcription elongation factor GreB n=1 Tax=Sulfurimicrobium lacus TaxID=2715678 RepID=A0A6F8V963_9PROT|nr:transcription elongation factor GreB [Sulfurimicrobium lacus]BCB26238.1 transcription elongation factor GreB [Sulfurimicrobium lacus]